MAEEPDLLISAGFSDAQLVREANKVVALYKKKGEEAQKAFVDSQGKVTNTQAAKAHARELDRLSKAYDPVYRAAKQYENELKRLDKALDIGAINQTQYTAKVEQAAAALRRVQQPMEVATRTSRGMGGSLQQVRYQVGDFAVQVGAGTSATQALGQQLPQLLGAFGTYGALAGAAAAITIPLGAALLKTALDAETLEEATKGLTESTDAFVDAAEAAATPIDDLRAKYGALADEIARANSVIASLTSIQARFDLLNTTQRLGGGLGFDLTPAPFDKVDLTPDQAQLNQRAQEKAMDRLRRITGATTEQFDQLRMAVARVESSNSVEAVVKDAENLLAIIAELSANDGADREMLLGWAQQVEAVLRQAERQVENSVDEQTRTYNRLIEEYDKDTQELKKLVADREAAETALAKAVKDGNNEQIASLKRVIEQQDKNLEKTKELARANDEVLQRRIRAQQQFQESQAEFSAVTGDAVELIKEFEGFRSTPYYDVNAYRAGFGSDTVTLADGSVQRVVQGMTVSIADANRDLVRRVGEFQGGIVSDIGADRFDSFTQEQQAALTSIAYNYGSLPDRIIAAVRSGTTGDIANAISGLAGDNSGINSDRRFREASAFGSGSVAKRQYQDTQKALKEEIKERERIAEQAKKYGEQLAANLLTQQQTAELEKQRADQVAAIKAQGLSNADETRAIAAVNAEFEKQRTIMSLLADAKRRNVDLDQLMTGSTLTYRDAIEALGAATRDAALADHERAAASQEAAEKQAFAVSINKQMKDGLLDAVIAGESFADVLANVAQMLAKAALQAALFNEGPWASGGGGGFLGGILNTFLGGGDRLTGALRSAGLPARANGGPVSAGEMYMTGERGPEPFVPAVDGRILSVVQAQAALRGGQSSGSMSYSPSIVVRGDANEKTLARMEGMLQREREQFFSRWTAAQKQFGNRIA